MPYNYDPLGITEYLTPQNAENLRFAQQTAPITLGGQGANINLQPTRMLPPAPMGNWDAPISYGAPATGYTDRTSSPEIAATLHALQIAKTLPSNQPPPDPALAKAQIAKLFATTAEAQARANPLLPDMPDADMVRAQIARDPTGTAGKILAALQGGHLASNNVQVPLAAPGVLHGYTPEGGFGGVPDPEGMRSTLDPKIVNLPAFQKIMQTDPDKAAYAYKAITGRELKDDMSTHGEVIKKREQFKLGLVSNLIKDGAYVDKATGKLMKWANVPSEGGGVASLGGDQRPVRKIMEASEDETLAYREMYSKLMGRTNPMETSIPQAAKGKGFVLNNEALNDPAVSAAIIAQEKKMSDLAGVPVTMTAKQKALVARQAVAAQGMSGNAGNPISPTWGDIGSSLKTSAGFVGDQVWDLLDAMRISNSWKPEPDIRYNPHPASAF